ncbi:MAG: tRNA (N(6)-L-threonylcarbamoyladenosine(37)-C(2))-methylthiotransferase MtaB [Clostridiales bacterium]|nr:tRNA (N(6)-L-threonylcarbamoyladenosine(37)-C(2))-methylthiotransferase MtaB [Clostridiales bacterium]
MKVSVFTLGCKTNLYESGQIIAQLQKAGHNAFHGLKEADVFVLNTCAVTGEAERKSRQAIARAKKLNPNCSVVVVGCAAEKNAQQFADIANVTYVKGVANKTAIVNEIERVGVDVEQLPSAYTEVAFATQERTRAFVKIQDGCNNFCSYCIVPYLRGRSRSRRIADVVEEVKQANAAETVLIGIDISQFGRDTGESLPQLFYALQGVNTRIRLGSLEARVVTDELLESLTKINFCPHFHLSLQSGCDTVLKRMNRKYSTQQYYEAVQKIRQVFPTAGITTDVIVGFSGETEEEFEATCRFVEKVNFADIHIFPYSPREGTVSANWADTDGVVKTQRAAKLNEIKQHLKHSFAESNCGTVQEILCERKRGGYYEGYTKEYLRVYFTGKAKIGEIVNVKILEPYLDGAKGVLSRL